MATTPIKHTCRTLLILIILACTGFGVAAQSGNALYGDVQAAHLRGRQFTEYNLFNYSGPATMLDGGTILLPQAQNIAKLYSEAPGAITIHLPSANGGFTLSLLQNYTATNFTNAIAATTNGIEKVAIDKGVHYTGCVEGQSQTLATMSVFANGDVMILFANKDGNYVAGKLQDNSGRYILYRDDAIKGLPPFDCKLKEGNTPTQQGEKTTGTVKGTCKFVKVYLEGDYDLYKKFSSDLTQTQNYLTGLFNQMSGIYQNDSMRVVLGSVKVWTVDDKYRDSISEYAIADFMLWWNNRTDTFGGDVAVLVANDKPNNGGIAPLRTLCSKSNSYAYADVDGAYKTIPVYSKDVMVISHEVGHLLGSMHTQWCGWNIAPGLCGSIDNCAAPEGSSVCFTCSTQYDNAAPITAWSGTIMSYCHQKPRGINLANGFGPLPGKEMRDNINNPMINYCLKTVIQATLKVDDICQGYGAITVVFDTNFINPKILPASSLLYYWTPVGATTQNISNITTPGLYGVSITDANGNCQIQYNTPVVVLNTDSCRFKAAVETTTASASLFSISPNPSRGTCHIVRGNADSKPYSIVISDILGSVLLRQDNIAADSYPVSTTAYAPGVYTVLVRTANNSQCMRLVVN